MTNWKKNKRATYSKLLIYGMLKTLVNVTTKGSDGKYTYQGPSWPSALYKYHTKPSWADMIPQLLSRKQKLQLSRLTVRKLIHKAIHYKAFYLKIDIPDYRSLMLASKIKFQHLLWTSMSQLVWASYSTPSIGPSHSIRWCQTEWSIHYVTKEFWVKYLLICDKRILHYLQSVWN
jgi:hypothetical protein